MAKDPVDIKNPKWLESKAALKKIQMHFTFERKQQRAIRFEAIDDDINPSDVIRKILGLTYRQVQRPRITASLTQAEKETLAQQFGVDINDDAQLRRLITEKVDRYYSDKEES